MKNPIKETKTFYVSVEGESEAKYLQNLQRLIRNSDSKYYVKFICAIKKPTSFIKAKHNMEMRYPIYHLCDYEGNNQRDETNFRHIIEDLAKASEMVNVNYELGYTNLCFELWLILHKGPFNKHLTNKEKYKDKLNELYNTQFNSWDDVKKSDNMDKILNKIELRDVFTAIKNAEEIEKNNSRTYKITKCKNYEYYKYNPSLSIHKFINYVLKECEIENY